MIPIETCVPYLDKRKLWKDDQLSQSWNQWKLLLSLPLYIFSSAKVTLIKELDKLFLFHHQYKNGLILRTGQWYAPLAVNNDAWYCKVLQCIARYCIILHGIAWYCMILHGIAWYCMVLYGIS